MKHTKEKYCSTNTALVRCPLVGNVYLGWYRKWNCSVVCDSLWSHGLYPTRLLCPWNFSGKSTGVGCHFLLQWIFLTQGSNLGLLHCRLTLYHLSHHGSPILPCGTWLVLPTTINTFSQGSSLSHETVPRSCDTSVSSVHLLSCVQLFATPQTAAHQASLSITNSRSLLKLMSIELVMSSNHLIFCRPLLIPPSIFLSIRVFSNESVRHIRWSKYWSFSFNISLPNEYSGLFSFRMDWLDLLAVQESLHSQESSLTPQFKTINSSVLKDSNKLQLGHTYSSMNKSSEQEMWCSGFLCVHLHDYHWNLCHMQW